MTLSEQNGKMLKMIDMINKNQERMDVKLDKILDRTSNLEINMASLPCSYMQDRINKIEKDTIDNNRFRWSLKGQISLIGTISALVSIFITYFRKL